jgi:hypothetical protein
MKPAVTKTPAGTRDCVQPGWNLVRRREAGDAAALDHHGSTAMPAAAVKNTVRNDGPPFGVWLVLAHICPR